MKSGYLYVLVHPSEPDLYKIGITIRKPEQRLAQHNSDYTQLTGQIVKKTGQKWELKEYHAVPDLYWAETAFWETMHRFGREEVVRVEWKWVQMCLNEATKASVRPPPKPRTRPVRNREWMIKQLEGTGITMIGHYRGLITGVEFQCEKGHVFKKSPGVVANRKSCPLCEFEEKNKEKHKNKTMYFLHYELIPSPNSDENKDAGGAFFNLWKKAKSMGEAKQYAEVNIEDNGWKIVKLVDCFPCSKESYESDDKAQKYYEEAEIYGESYLYQLWLKEPEEE